MSGTSAEIEPQAIEDKLASLSLASSSNAPTSSTLSDNDVTKDPIYQSRFDEDATQLVNKLQKAASQGSSRNKTLIRPKKHPAYSQDAKPKNKKKEHTIVSWKTQEFAYRKTASSLESYFGDAELPTLARGLYTEELDDAAGGKGTGKHRIVIRGYDKFFNRGEMAWTKPASLKKFSQPPYLLTFKENGCIIFISALTPSSLIVTSKHSLGGTRQQEEAEDNAEGNGEVGDVTAASAGDITAASAVASQLPEESNVSHARKGSEWLDRHLSRVGKTREQLAAELWSRNETAAFELCDDSFEEHVLAYEPERSGLYLHGLNSNSSVFSTRDMREVDAFAKEWGFLPTRWLEMNTYDEVEALTDEIGRTGMWHGEPLEGFVVRTRIPDDVPTVHQVLQEQQEQTKQGESVKPAAEVTARPPYEPGQTWFFKVKFDEPYLMYRDWRELTRRMLTDQAKWTKEHGRDALEVILSGQSAQQAEEPRVVPGAVPAMPDSTKGEMSNDDEKSKNQRKREAKKAALEARQAAEAAARKRSGRHSLPERPSARSKRPETLAFVEWCYDKLWGSSDGKVQAEPALFELFTKGKGIINVRDRFLQFCETPEGHKSLARHGKQTTQQDNEVDSQDKDRPFTKTLIVPIAVPGCGKTVLGVALRHLFPEIGHTQSDDVQSKKTADTFLKNIQTELQKHDMVIADRNNHLFKHRNEIVELVRRIEMNGFAAAGKSPVKGAKKASQQHDSTPEEPQGKAQKPRIRLVAMTWALDALSSNQIFRICCGRIVARGENHQSIRVETTDGSAKDKNHEKILWRFLKEMQPFGSALGGDGTDGAGDERFDERILLHVDAPLERNLRILANGLREATGGAVPEVSQQQLDGALGAAQSYKVVIKKPMKDAPAGRFFSKPRYYAIAVELDLGAAVRDAVGRIGSIDANDMENVLACVDKLAKGNRITAHPHITLVHQQTVKAEESGAETGDSARTRWARYEALCQDGALPVEFSFHLDKLVWDGHVMAFSVRDVKSERVSDFEDLQGGGGGETQGSWRPHITIGTASDEVRPFEAHRALLEAEAGKPGVKLIELGKLNFEAKGILRGMVA